MPRVGQGGLGHVLADRLHRLAVLEEEHAFVPGDRDHHAQAMLLRQVEEPARRRMIDAKHVHTDFAHQPEIDRDLLRRGQVRPGFGRGPERAVGHPLEIKFRLALEEKLRPHLQAGEIGRGGGRHGSNIMHGGEFPRAQHLRQDRNERAYLNQFSSCSPGIRLK